MLKGCRNSVNQIQVYEARHHAGQDKETRVDTLYLQKIQIPQTHDQGLNHRQEDENHLPSEVSLTEGKLLHLLVLVHFLFHDGDEHHAAYPEGQIRIEGRHAGAIVLHLIEGGAVQLDGRGHKFGNRVRIDILQIQNLLVSVGSPQGLQIALKAGQTLIHQGQGISCLLQGLGTGGQAGVQFIQKALHLVCSGCHILQGGLHIAGETGHRIQ